MTRLDTALISWHLISPFEDEFSELLRAHSASNGYPTLGKHFIGANHVVLRGTGLRTLMGEETFLGVGLEGLKSQSSEDQG